MRRLVGLCVPLVFVVTLLVASLQNGGTISGLEWLVTLLMVGTFTGYFLGTRWAILYAPAFVGISWAAFKVFEVGRHSFAGYESRSMVILELFMIMALVAFGARTGREIAV